MARVSWSFNFAAVPTDETKAAESSAADARAKAAAWVKDKLPMLGMSAKDAEGVAGDVSEGVEIALAIASKRGLDANPVALRRDNKDVKECFFVELTGRVGPDAASRHGAALGVFVSAPIPA